MLKIKPFVSEFIGTFCFVFIGAGVVVADQFTHSALGLLGIALAHGLCLAALITAFGAVSTGYFNPAVSLGLFIANRIGRPTFITFLITQLLGGVLAGLLLRCIFPASVWETAFLGAPHVMTGVSVVSALVVEFILSFIFTLVVFGTSVDPIAPKLGGLAIGFAYAALFLFGWPLAGAVMNPIRALGPALAANFWDGQWLYWVGPLAGASLASWVYTHWISETI